MKELKINNLISILDEMDEGRGDIQEERLCIIDELCNYLEIEDVLFRVTVDLLLYGPIFGNYYDKIVPSFFDENKLGLFREYCENMYWDGWKQDFLQLVFAIESYKNNGMYIVGDELKSVFKETQEIRIPNTVKSIARYAFFDNLPSVTKCVIIPNSVKRIEDAFCIKKDAFSIIFEGTPDEWDSIEIGVNQWGERGWFDELNVTYTYENFYDVFISYKSQDMPIARSVYDYLTSYGKKVFFSCSSLPEIGRDEYTDAIYEALDKSKHMVLITSDIQHVKSGWVKDEWCYFMGEVREGRKGGNVILVIHDEMVVNKKSFPPQLRHKEIVKMSEFQDKLLGYLQ